MSCLLTRGIDQHGKAFKILFPRGSIPCSEDARKYSKAKKEQKRTK